jgi:hypothetical protein
VDEETKEQSRRLMTLGSHVDLEDDSWRHVRISGQIRWLSGVVRAIIFADLARRPRSDLGPDVTLQDLGIGSYGGCDLVRRRSARCKAARAKRVDDERVRKCASHVGELVQSHPSSASAVLSRRARSPKLEDAIR